MKIKKGWKITWISLGSLLGTVLLLVGVALWIIFTPSQLTKVVNRLAGNFLDCDAHFEEVDFTFISTFPDAGLKIKNVTLVKRMEGAPNDTLAFIGDVTIGIDLMAYLKNDELIVHQVYVDNAEANLYIDKEGRCNFAIVPPSEDTTKSEPPALIDLKKVKVRNLTARLKDEHSGMNAEVCGFSLTMNGCMRDSELGGRLEAASRRMWMERNDASGRQQMLAEIEGFDLGADFEKGALSADAQATVKGERVAFRTVDSTGEASLAMVIDDFAMALKGSGGMSGIGGTIALEVENGTCDMRGRQMVNSALQAAEAPLLKVELPFRYNPINKNLTIEKTTVDVADVGLEMRGEVGLDSLTAVNMAIRSAGDWDLG